MEHEFRQTEQEILQPEEIGNC